MFIYVITHLVSHVKNRDIPLDSPSVFRELRATRGLFAGTRENKR